MAQVKTAELIGSALDWAVAKCEKPEWLGNQALTYVEKCDFNPSTDWAQGGPIIERELISLETKFINATAEHPNGRWTWQASCVTEDDMSFWLDGPNPLIAAMRCYVASKLGDVVKIPDELVGV